MDDETLIQYGDAIKSIEETPDGLKVGGYLVRFSTLDDTDLAGDYFTADTDFGEAEKSDGWFNHRKPVYFKNVEAKAYKSRIGSVSLRKDNVGVWAETVLQARNEYEQEILKLAKAGKLGWSSGTASHLVEREQTGKSYRITAWPLGLDASLTPTPAEPRNGVMSIKSLIPAGGVAEAEQNQPEPTNMENAMEATEVDVKAIVAAELAKRDAEIKAAELKAAELKAAEDAGYKKALEDLRLRGFNAPVFNTNPLGFSEEKDAVPAFKAWMQTGQENQGLIRPGADLMNIKAAFNVTTGATGGYLVPDPLLDRIIAKRNLASWVRQAPCQRFTTDSDHLLVPREDTSHTAFVETAEGIAYNENEGTVAQVDMILKKYTKVTKVTEEFLAGRNSNWESWMAGALARAEAVTENTVATAILLTGATAGTAAAGQAAITIPEIMRLTGHLTNGYNITGEVGFLMRNATRAYLQGVGMVNNQPWAFGGYPAWVSDDMEALATGQKATLFGNFNYFGVLERPGMLVQRNPYLYMATGEVGIFANIFRAYAVLQGEAFYTMAQA
jgi:HK97 family phage major capsid protein